MTIFITRINACGVKQMRRGRCGCLSPHAYIIEIMYQGCDTFVSSACQSSNCPGMGATWNAQAVDRNTGQSGS